jgi:hypothetical protein
MEESTLPVLTTPLVEGVAQVIQESLPKTSVKLSPIELPDETRALTIDLDEAAKKLANLEALINQTFAAEAKTDATHTHFYSGNRLWKNDLCPICKAESMKNSVDYEAIKKAEKENDKMLLHISLDIDREYLEKKKVQLSCFNPFLGPRRSKT